MITFLDEISPLEYPNAYGPVLRLSIVDTEAPPPLPDETYYVPTQHRRTKGRRSVLEKLPGASPGVVGFADYRRWPDGTVYVYYVHVRRDQQRRGLACQLVDHLYEKFEDAPCIDFGTVLHEAMEKLCQRKRASGRATRWKVW